MRVQRKHSQHGLTLVEIMVSLAVVGITAGLVFGVQIRMTTALSNQEAISEMQQMLWSASSMLKREIRQAGYLAHSTYATPWGSNGTVAVGPVTVYNRRNGMTDEIHLMSAATNCLAHVCDYDHRLCPKDGPSFKSSETEIDDTTCFHDGDVAYAVHTRAPVVGCILAITHDPQSNASGNNKKIQHNPGQGQPWNQPGNAQCDALSGVWNDGYTIFTKIRLRAFRIKPADPRGVLQVSDDGGTTWSDLALGIVDMQFAVRVWHDHSLPHDAHTADLDGDGDPNRDWYSGDDMETAPLDLVPTGNTDPAKQPTIHLVSLTLVAKTTKEVDGASVTEIPSLIDPGFFGANADVNHNRQSDRGPEHLPPTDSTSMYAGSRLFRTLTTTIDLRNVGANMSGG